MIVSDSQRVVQSSERVHFPSCHCKSEERARMSIKVIQNQINKKKKQAPANIIPHGLGISHLSIHLFHAVAPSLHSAKVARAHQSLTPRNSPATCVGPQNVNDPDVTSKYTPQTPMTSTGSYPQALVFPPAGSSRIVIPSNAILKSRECRKRQLPLRHPGKLY